MQLEGSLAVALVMAACSAFAEEYTVSTVADLYEKVRTASPGDVITAQPGTYKMTAELGTLTITNGITVQSAGTWRNTFFEPAEGVTDKRLVMVAHAQGVFKGFTLRNVTTTAALDGMALFIDDPSGGTVSDCCITGCSGTGTRYVVRLSCGSVLKRCRIVGNSASSVISVNSGSNKEAYGKTCRIVNCLVCDNGGSVFYWPNLAHLSVVVDHCTVADNNSGGFLSNPSREAKYYNSVLLPASVYPCAFAAPFASSLLGARAGTQIKQCFYSGPNPSFQNCTYAGIVHGHPYDGFVNATANDYRPAAGSPLIGAAAVSTYAEGVDIDGNARGSAPTIGCFEYDAAATDAGVVVNLPVGGDLAAAVKAAEAGTVIRLAAGSYTLSEKVTVDKRLWIVGADRDKTIIKGGTGFDLFGLTHFRARISGLTVTDSVNTSAGGRAFVMTAGWVDDCRVTGLSVRDDINVYGLGANLTGGCVSHCQFDGNRSVNSGKINTSVLYLSSATPSAYTKVGIALDCLVVGNEIGVSHEKRVGQAVYLTRNGTGDGGQLRDSTVIGNYTSVAVAASVYVGLVQNCIISDYQLGSSQSWSQGGGSSLKTGTASTVWCNNCSAVPIGSACVSDGPGVRLNGRLKPGSPCIGVAKKNDWSAYDLDLAGNPRLRKDGAQDIGCLQYMPSGLMMLVR